LKEIACFISPHGFGHATRTIAILEALQKQLPDLYPHIFTTVPESLFSETLHLYSYHPVQTDIGLEQKGALEIDIDKTLKNLAFFLPFPQKLIDHCASLCATCPLVLCDIAPLGIAIAEKLGIPSVLIENFTWDWIYAPHKSLNFYAQLLQQKFNRATCRIQTEPLCQQKPHDLLCGPIFRKYRKNKITIRNELGAGSKNIVVITTGGIRQELPVWKEMSAMTEFLFIILGQQEGGKKGNNILTLEKQTSFYHPDLINCADLVVCKAGYSTIAECFQAGVRVITVDREDFPESRILIDFLKKNMSGISIHQNTFFSGDWLHGLNEILTLPPASPAKENGADKVASFLKPLIKNITRKRPPLSTAHNMQNPHLSITYLLKDLIEFPSLSEENRQLLLQGLNYSPKSTNSGSSEDFTTIHSSPS